MTRDLSSTTRRDFIRSGALGALALGALAGSPASVLARVLQPAASPEQVPELMGILGWTPLQKDIYAIADITSGGNTLLVASQGKALLVDTKFPYIAGALLQDAANQIGADITASDSIELTLINTHHHGDHTGGNAIIVPIASASYAHANALPRIREQHQRFVQGAQAGPSELARNNADEKLMPFAKSAAEASKSWTEKTAVPKIAISGSGNTLSIGGITVSTKHFGTGHTDNDLVIHLPDHNIVHTGDLVFNGLHPFFDPSANATARGWIESLKQTRKLCNAETTVIPGHGPIAGPEIIDTQINYFESLIAAIQTEIDKGTPKEEISAMSWDFMNGLGFEQIRTRMIEGVYDELSA
jgi:glyoxylase-like metal-dependent hydrolase (beta-lactamase superfamily II)